jgi:aminoglycoside phosphotransferase (APT) family kinase protein
MMGGQNCHVEITFQDNVKWIARFRLEQPSSPPQELRDWILQSEVATMVYLQEHTLIPTPKVFDWACESDLGNPLGIGYILMEKLDGKPLRWPEATPKQREKVMQQLAGILLEIEKHPFKAMGSLVFSEGGTIDIQGLADPSTFQLGKGPLGPFSSSLEGSQAMIKTYLAMIARGEIDNSCPVDNYLVHQFCLDIVNTLWKDVPLKEQFFLKHPDDKGDHILVNDSFDIVGIIDWEWTHTVSKAEAFSSPCMMWPVDKFYKGSNKLEEDELRLAAIFRERGREDLARCVIEGRKVQRFFFVLGTSSSFISMQELHDLFMGLQRVFNSNYKGWGHWKGKALEKWKDDPLLLSLLEQEKVEDA